MQTCTKSQCPLRGSGLCGVQRGNLLHGEQQPVSMPSTRAGSLRALPGVMIWGAFFKVSMPSTRAGSLRASSASARPGTCTRRVSMPSTRAGSLGDAAAVGRWFQHRTVSMPSTRAGSLRVLFTASSNPAQDGVSMPSTRAGSLRASREMAIPEQGTWSQCPLRGPGLCGSPLQDPHDLAHLHPPIR